MPDARLTYAIGMMVLFALLALTACTPTAADWPEGRGAEPPAPVWHGQPEPNPPSIDREDG